MVPTVLDLNATISNMLRMLTRLIGENIELVWKPGADLHRVKMDRAQVDQILANLAVNARDAINGVGRLAIATENVNFDQAYCDLHAGFLPGAYVQMSVSDNGAGMSTDVQAQLFEPFFTTKDVGKGTGLGLATVYGIVKQNGGFFSVYSELGHGSTFKVFLPETTDKVAQARPVANDADVVPGAGTILVVEDEEALLRLTKRLLEQLGYSVLAASTPKEALALAELHPQIDLLLTDVIMPNMNGKMLCELITKNRPNTKCLFMSGYTADIISRDGLLADGLDFLPKPFSINDLARKVAEVLAK